MGGNGRRSVGRKVTAVCAVFVMLCTYSLASVTGVAGAAEQTLAAPGGLTPNGGTVGPNPTLSWNAVPGADHYKVTYPNTQGNNVTSTVYATAYAPTVDFPVGTVSWSVVAYDKDNNYSPTSNASFANQAASGPTLSCPPPTVNYPAQAPTFSWTEVTGVKTYSLQVSTSDTFVPAATTTYQTQATSYTVTKGLPDDQTYYAKVSGASANGINTPPSTTCQFKVVWSKGSTNLNDAQVTLQSPTDRATVRDLHLKWTPLQGAARYELQVSPNGDWTNNLLYDIVTDSTVWSPAKTLDNGAYFWRVRGIDNQDNKSRWSDYPSTTAGDAWQFTVAPLGEPTLISPANGALGVTNFLLSWSPVKGAGAYELQIDTDQNFSNFINQSYAIGHTCITTQTDWGPYTYENPPGQFPGPGGNGTCQLNRTVQTGYTDGVPLYWRVRALDDYTAGEVTDPWSTGAFTTVNKPPSGAMNGKWSTTFKFEYHTASPMEAPGSGPNLTSPPNGASVTVPRLTWNEIPGTQYYKVNIYKGGNLYWSSSTAATSYVPSLQTRDDLPPAAGKSPITYSWSVQAVDYNGRVSPQPPTRDFTWTGFQPGVSATTITPVGDTPADNATVTGIPTFSWTPVIGADHYVLAWFDSYGSTTYTPITDINRGGSQVNPVAESFTPTQPLPAGAHGWAVFAFAKNSTTSFASSAKYHINVKSPLTPGVPTGITTRVDATHTTSCADLDAGCNVASTPLVSWRRNDAASFYRVYLSLDPNFTNVLRTYDTAQTALRSVEALPDNQAGQSYYWFVQSCIGDWKVTSSVTCGPNDPSVWTAPYLSSFHKQSSPVSGLKTLEPTSAAAANSASACDDAPNATTISDVPTFCWNTSASSPYVSGDIGAMSYHVQVSTTPDFSNIIDQAWTDQRSYTPYSWPQNANAGYNPQSVITPPSSQTIRDVTYPDGPLYWRVQAVDSTGNALTYATYDAFPDAQHPGIQPVTKDSSAPFITGPADGGTVSGTPSLSWKAKPLVAQYQVQVARNGDMNFSQTNIAFAQFTDLTAITPSNNNSLTNGTALPAGTYAWRVRGVDAGGNSGAWSDVRSFVVRPSAPSLTAPANNASFTTSAGLLFKWTTVPGAVTYRFYLSKNNPPTSSPTVNITTVSNAWAIDRALSNSPWYWEVQALDGQGQVLSTSSVNRFNFDGTRPSVTLQRAAPLEEGANLTWDTTPASAVGRINSFTIQATDPTNSANSRTVVVVPSATVSPPNTGGSNGTTICSNPTTTSVTMHCAYNMLNLVDNVSYTVTITPFDANGAGTSGNLTARPVAWAGFGNLKTCATWMYQEFLSTNPNPAPNPTSGTCSAQAYTYWRNSQFQSMFAVARLYHAYFLRAPDYAGLKFWMKRRATPGTTWTLNNISSFFAGSSEFTNRYGSMTNGQFVNLVYQNVLGRPADSTGYTYYVTRLNNGSYTRGRVMTAFSESSEYQRIMMPQIKAEMVVLMIDKRSPTAAEIDYYKTITTGSDPNTGASTALRTAMRTGEFSLLGKGNPNG